MTQPSHANPHRIFWHCFSRLSETLRKPLETQGNPHSCSGNPEVTPVNAFTHPLRPYKAFTLHRAFRFWAQTPRRLHSIGRRQHTTLEHTFRARQFDGQDSLTRALKTSCHLELKIRRLPSPLLTSRNLWDSNPRGETPSAQQANALAARLKVSYARRSKSAAFESRQSCDCQSLLLLPPSPRHLARSHRLMRTMCISRESNPGQMATMYSTTRPLMPLENLWT